MQQNSVVAEYCPLNNPRLDKVRSLASHIWCTSVYNIWDINIILLIFFIKIEQIFIIYYV